MAQNSAGSGSVTENNTRDGGALLENGTGLPSSRPAEDKNVSDPAAAEAGPSAAAAAAPAPTADQQEDSSLVDIFQTGGFTAGLGPVVGNCHRRLEAAGGHHHHHHHHHHHDPFLSNGSYDVDGARLFAESDEEEEEEEEAVVNSLEAVYGPERREAAGLFASGSCPPGTSARDVGFATRAEPAGGGGAGDWADPDGCFFPR